LAGDARVALAGPVHGAGEGFEEALDDVVGFVAVEEFEVEIAAGLVGKGLEELVGEAETEGGGTVLVFLLYGDFLVGLGDQTAPYQIGSAAEINDAAGQAFVHGDVGFGGQGVAGVKTGAVAAEAGFVAQGEAEGLAFFIDGLINCCGADFPKSCLSMK